MSINYYTKEEALKAVGKNGYSLASVASYLKDDYDVVFTAITHGGPLANASFRLQNSIDLIIAEAKEKLIHEDKYCADFPSIVFCAKQNTELLNLYAEKFSDWDEFMIEMKLYYGDSFVSSIPQYNHMSAEELQKKLSACRKTIIDCCREIYNKKYPVEELKYHRKLSKAVRHRTLRWSLTARGAERKAFASLVVDVLEREINQIESVKHKFANTTGGSYPERFLDSVLSCLGIEFHREQIFPWSKDTEYGTKRYDFYLPDSQTIIEVHGAQHYDGGFEKMGGRSAEEEQINDKFKRDIAKSNGIANYIEIDASSSSPLFLQNSLLNNSDLCRTIDISQIDWQQVKTFVEQNDVLPDTPLLDEKIAYNKMLLDLFNNSFVSSDYVLPPIIQDNYSRAERELMQCPKSSKGIYPHEIMLLKRLSGCKVGSIPSWIENAWAEHFQTPLTIHVNTLIENHLLYIVKASDALDRFTIPELKKCLHDYSLDSSGSKKALVERIADSLSPEAINKSITSGFYELTDDGIEEIVDYSFLFFVQEVDLSIWDASQFFCENREKIEIKYASFKKQVPKTLPFKDIRFEWYGKQVAKYLRGIKYQIEKNNR